jgi:hypothetical protein
MPHPRLQGATIAVPKASNPTVYPTATGHSDQCSYHCDQYDWECDCGHTNKATNAWAMREMRAAEDAFRAARDRLKIARTRAYEMTRGYTKI